MSSAAEHAKDLDALRARVKGRAATLITATREVDLSHAAVMRELLSGAKDDQFVLIV